MNKWVIGLGLAVICLAAFYFSDKTRHASTSPLLTYGLGIAACLFISILLFKLLQNSKKK